MDTQQIAPFYLIGLAIRTTNENGQSSVDIPRLWNQFLSDKTAALIPNKSSNDLYCVYTEYEKDHTRPYTTLLGCKVDNLDSIPAGLTGITVSGGSYVDFKVRGNLAEGIVFQKWTKIWNSQLARAYTTDFEIYGDKAQDQTNAEVDIMVGIQ